MLRDKYSAIPYFEFLKDACEMNRCKNCSFGGTGTVFKGPYAYGISRRVIGRVPVHDGLPSERMLYWGYCREEAVIEEIDPSFLEGEPFLKGFAADMDAPFDDKSDVRVIGRVGKLLSEVKSISMSMTDKKLSKLMVAGTLAENGRRIDLSIFHPSKKDMKLSSSIPLTAFCKELDGFTVNLYDLSKVLGRMEDTVLCFDVSKKFFRITKQSDERGKTLFVLKNYQRYK